MFDHNRPTIVTRLVPVFAAIILILIGFTAGLLVRTSTLPTFAGTDAATQPDLSLVQQAWRIVNDHYVLRDQLEPTQLERGAVRGLVDSIGDDGHSRYLSPDEWKQEQSSLQGQFEGIGAEVQMKDNRPVIVAPLEGSPAQQAGLQPGDIILRVEGADTAELSLDEVVRRIRGNAGTSVTITILRPSTNQTQDLTITRQPVKLQPATWTIVPGTNFAHIHLTQFSDGVGDALKEAIEAAKGQGAEGIILDLRNNPGGLLEQAIVVGSQFLSEGNILLEEDASGNRKPYPVRPGGIATEIPLVVLTNNGSASAAEIIAGAVQDHSRAPVIGVRTFGTGTVLSTFRLDDGSAILLGVEQWLTPNGKQIWHQGIEPDIRVELPAGVNPLLPSQEKNLDVAGVQAHNDTQLTRAIEVLRSKVPQPVASVR